jgi:hypothetical protein
MARSFADFRSKIAEDTAATHVGSGAADVHAPEDRNFKIVDDKIDPSSIIDFNRWLTALSAFISPTFPAREIETRLNLYGYTAYLDDEYLSEEDENEGEEMIPVYVYSTGVEVKNLVINISWQRDEDLEYHISAQAEVISDAEFAALMVDDDAEIAANLDVEDEIKAGS